MTSNYYQRHKERLQKEACKRYQNYSEKEKDKRRKNPEKDIKILLKKEAKKDEINMFLRKKCKYQSIES